MNNQVELMTKLLESIDLLSIEDCNKLIRGWAKSHAFVRIPKYARSKHGLPFNLSASITSQQVELLIAEANLRVSEQTN